MHHGYQAPLPPHGFRWEDGCRSVAVSHVMATGSFSQYSRDLGFLSLWVLFLLFYDALFCRGWRTMVIRLSQVASRAYRQRG